MNWTLSNNPLAWPWWLQLAIAVPLIIEALLFVLIRRASRRFRRHVAYVDRLILRRERRVEDVLWAALRRQEAQHALAITYGRQRAARDLPKPLLREVTG